MATKKTNNKFGNALDDWFSEEKSQEVRNSENKNPDISGNKNTSKSESQQAKKSASSKSQKPEKSESQNPQTSKSQDISMSETKQSEKLENLPKKEMSQPKSKNLKKSGSKKTRMSGNLVLRPKTFDLPPSLVTRIKIEAAQTGKKEYQIALEAFEKFFKERFEG